MPSIHGVGHALLVVLKVALAAAVVALFGYGRYLKARKASDDRDRKADVQTLFGGKR